MNTKLDKPICGSCGKPADEGYLNEVNPYISELYPEDLTDDDTHDWCENCYTQACDDI